MKLNNNPVAPYFETITVVDTLLTITSLIADIVWESNSSNYNLLTIYSSFNNNTALSVSSLFVVTATSFTTTNTFISILSPTDVAYEAVVQGSYSTPSTRVILLEIDYPY